MAGRRIGYHQRKAQLSSFDDGDRSKAQEHEAALYAAARDVHRDVHRVQPMRRGAGAADAGDGAFDEAVERGAAEVDWAGKATRTSRRRHFYHGESEVGALPGMMTHTEVGSLLPAPGTSGDAYAEHAPGSAPPLGARRGVASSRDLHSVGHASELGGAGGRSAANPMGTAAYQRDLRCADHTAADWITTAQRQQLSVAQAREAEVEQMRVEAQQQQQQQQQHYDGGVYGGAQYGAQPQQYAEQEPIRAAIDHDSRAPGGRRTFDLDVAPRAASGPWMPTQNGTDLLSGVLDGITNTVLAAERQRSGVRGGATKGAPRGVRGAAAARNAVLLDAKNREQILLNYNPHMAGTTKARRNW